MSVKMNYVYVSSSFCLLDFFSFFFFALIWIISPPKIISYSVGVNPISHDIQKWNFTSKFSISVCLTFLWRISCIFSFQVCISFSKMSWSFHWFHLVLARSHKINSVVISEIFLTVTWSNWQHSQTVVIFNVTKVSPVLFRQSW